MKRDEGLRAVVFRSAFFELTFFFVTRRFTFFGFLVSVFLTSLTGFTSTSGTDARRHRPQPLVE